MKSKKLDKPAQKFQIGAKVYCRPREGEMKSYNSHKGIVTTYDPDVNLYGVKVAGRKIAYFDKDELGRGKTRKPTSV